MSITASYLPPIGAEEYDPGQYVPELSRRARGFAVWAQLRALGRRGVAEMVGGHCVLARRLASRLAAEPGVHVLNSVHLNQVLVNFGGGTHEERDAFTRATIARMQADNACFTGGADWHGRWVLRLSVISASLTDTDIDRLATAVLSSWRTVQHEVCRPSTFA